jgi:hypothetical protein
MFQLTNYNIRRRYLEEKEKARKKGQRFTYQDMAEMFESDDRSIYTWVSRVAKMQHLPANEAKRAKISAWLNDGTLKEKKK